MPCMTCPSSSATPGNNEMPSVCSPLALMRHRQVTGLELPFSDADAALATSLATGLPVC